MILEDKDLFGLGNQRHQKFRHQGEGTVASVSFKNVYKKYAGDVLAVKDLNIDVVDGRQRPEHRRG